VLVEGFFGSAEAFLTPVPERSVGLTNLRLTRQGPNPQWTWVEFANRKKVVHRPDPVYEAASLRALRRRGRLEDDHRYLHG